MSEVNHAFIAIKLWLLLALKCSVQSQDADNNDAANGSGKISTDRYESSVWNELWPPFQRLIALFEADWDEDNVDSSVRISVSTTV